MDDLTAKDLDDICALVIENRDGVVPKLEEFLTWIWDKHTPKDRDLLIGQYKTYLYVYKRRWAWDGLVRLLFMLEERGEPLPSRLQNWAFGVIAQINQGTLKIPHRPRSKRFAPQDDRDLRIAIAIQLARRVRGLSRETAIAAVAGALNMPEDTVRSAFRKIEKFGPIIRPFIQRLGPKRGINKEEKVLEYDPKEKVSEYDPFW